MNIFGTLVNMMNFEVNILCTLNIISDLLKEQKKTQKDLTDFLGITKNAFTNWKNGDNTSYLKKLPEISDFFNVSVDYLLGKTNIPNSSELDEQLKDEQFALWGEVKDLTDDEKQDVIDFIDYIKSKRKDGD